VVESGELDAHVVKDGVAELVAHDLDEGEVVAVQEEGVDGANARRVQRVLDGVQAGGGLPEEGRGGPAGEGCRRLPYHIRKRSVSGDETKSNDKARASTFQNQEKNLIFFWKSSKVGMRGSKLSCLVSWFYISVATIMGYLMVFANGPYQMSLVFIYGATCKQQTGDCLSVQSLMVLSRRV